METVVRMMSRLKHHVHQPRGAPCVIPPRPSRPCQGAPIRWPFRAFSRTTQGAVRARRATARTAESEGTSPKGPPRQLSPRIRVMS